MKENELELDTPLEEFTRTEQDVLIKIVDTYNEEHGDIQMFGDEEKAYYEILKKLGIE